MWWERTLAVLVVVAVYVVLIGLVWVVVETVTRMR